MVGWPPQGTGGIPMLPTTGTYAHPNDTSEHDVFTIALTRSQTVSDIMLDVNALTQRTTFKIYCKIDGTTYREIDSVVWVTTDRKGVSMVEVTTDKDVKVTAQSAVAEGAVRSIPYRYVLVG